MADSMRPRQDRSLKTQQQLLDALDNLLQTHSFEQLTVAQIAAEAGLTTGAIYRRFKDKRDLLQMAFQRFAEQSQALQTEREEAMAGLQDWQKLEYMIRSILEFTIPYIPLMRAVSTLSDQSSYESMLSARNSSADWLAANLETSPLQPAVLRTQCRFALRMVSAVIRDTLLTGSEKGQSKKALDSMVHELTVMTASYLKVPQ